MPTLVHYCLVTALLVLATVPLHAQRRGLGGVLGAQIGYSRSDLGGPDGDPFESREGSQVGLLMNLRLSRAVAVQPELTFSLKGGRTRVTVEDAEGGGSSEQPLDIELAYIEVPLLARVSVPFRTDRIRPVAFAGPVPAVKLGCDLDLLLTGSPLRAPCDDLGDVEFNDFDFGMLVGAGLEIQWADGGLALELRRTIGLRSIVEGSDVRNRTWAVTLGVAF